MPRQVTRRSRLTQPRRCRMPRRAPQPEPRPRREAVEGVAGVVARTAVTRGELQIRAQIDRGAGESGGERLARDSEIAARCGLPISASRRSSSTSSTPIRPTDTDDRAAASAASRTPSSRRGSSSAREAPRPARLIGRRRPRPRRGRRHAEPPGAWRTRKHARRLACTRRPCGRRAAASPSITPHAAPPPGSPSACASRSSHAESGVDAGTGVSSFT